MAKWRRRGGGRKRWVIEYVPRVDAVDGAAGEPDPFTFDRWMRNSTGGTVLGAAPAEPDPFTFDTPEAIRAALARFEQRKMIEDMSTK